MKQNQNLLSMYSQIVLFSEIHFLLQLLSAIKNSFLLLYFVDDGLLFLRCSILPAT
jgi:hypothetical protein